MSQPELKEIPDLPPQLKYAALDGNLVLFVGAGASMLLGMPSWSQLAWGALDYLRELGKIDYSELDQLKVLDPKKQLSIAKQIAKKESVHLDLTKNLVPRSGSGIYEYLNSIGAVCVTTNYDEELSPHCFMENDDGSSIPRDPRRIVKKSEINFGHLNDPGTVIHLHGSKRDPDGMIVTTKDYLEHYEEDCIKSFLRSLFDKKTVLFIGYGLEETELLEHILRKSDAREESEKKRFSLQGFFSTQAPLYNRLNDYYQQSFGVSILGYLRDRKDYHQLEEVMRRWSDELIVRPPALIDEIDWMNGILGGF
jgi:hypothetical protein